MMSLGRAKRFAESHFPVGPEKLAEELGVMVLEGPLAGCDGWVLSGPTGTLIRIDSNATAARRRFTLAHELSHLLLAIPTVVGELVDESLSSNNAEERKVNDLAAELLLPESIVRRYIPSVPVVADQLRLLAKKARVSVLAAAIRVANLAQTIGLENASVAFFQNDNLEWHWSKTLKMPPKEALELLRKADACHPEPARIQQFGTNDVVIASLLKNVTSQYVMLFVQLLPAEVGNLLSSAEKREQLETYLFKNDDQFRRQLQGVFGAFRSKCTTWPVDVAVEEFYKIKRDRWEGERRSRLLSSKGREYVRLRLQEFCS